MAYWVLCSGSHLSIFNVSVRLHSLLEFGFSRLPKGGRQLGREERSMARIFRKDRRPQTKVQEHEETCSVSMKFSSGAIGRGRVEKRWLY